MFRGNFQVIFIRDLNGLVELGERKIVHDFKYYRFIKFSVRRLDVSNLIFVSIVGQLE